MTWLDALWLVPACEAVVLFAVVLVASERGRAHNKEAQ